jgi:hypothetical protein
MRHAYPMSWRNDMSIARPTLPHHHPWPVAVAVAATAVATGLGLLTSAGSSRAASTPTPTDSPPARPSAVQWAAARPGGDQHAQEQSNYDAYFRDAANSGPTGQGRAIDLADALLDMADDLQATAALRAAATNDLVSQAARIPFIAAAAGSEIAPLPAVVIPALSRYRRWLQALPTQAADLNLHDPTTVQAEQAIAQQAPALAEQLLENVYMDQGQPPKKAATSAAEFVRIRRVTKPKLTSGQVDQLRSEFDAYLTSAQFPQGLEVSEARIFRTFADLYNAKHGSNLGWQLFQRAVAGTGAYAAGHPDANDVPFKEPEDFCPADYVCPPGPAVAGDTAGSDPMPSTSRYVPTWPAAAPGQDQQLQEQESFNQYYQLANSTPNGQARAVDLANSILDIDSDLRAHPRNPAAANDLITQISRFPFIEGATGSEIPQLPKLIIPVLGRFRNWLDAMPTTVADFKLQDPTTIQTGQAIQQQGPALAESILESVYAAGGQTAAQAATSASDYMHARQDGSPPALTSAQVDELRAEYTEYVDGLAARLPTIRDIFRAFTDQYNARHGSAIGQETILSVVAGTGDYRYSKLDKNGVPFRLATDYCPTSYVCPPGPRPPSK